MARIQGITIEIDGNTTGLQKALGDVDKASRKLTNELRQVDRALKFDPGNVELMAQKQQILAQQVEVTTTRLNRLKTAQQQVEAQFASGKIGADQYRAFQREIITTESRLKSLRTEINKIDDTTSVRNLKSDFDKAGKGAKEATESVHRLAEGLEDLEMFAGMAGDALSKAFETALDSSTLDTNIEIAFDVPPESIKTVKDAVKTVESYGIDAEAALDGVRRQWALNKDASDASNASIAKGAATIARAYSGLDFSEVIQEVNETAAALDISNESALALTDSLLQAGFPPEQIDIISEYGTQLKAAGFDAQQIQAIFAAGVDTKSWNIDNLIDGIKEGRIRLAEFGEEIPPALEPLIEKAGISEQQMQQWGQAVAKGGKEGQQAMVEVAKTLDGVEDATLKNALGVAVWGTMYEDQGQNILDTLINADQATKDLGASQDELSQKTAQLDADPAVQLAQAMSDLKAAMAPVLAAIAQIVSAFAEWISANPVVAATITGIVMTLGLLLGTVAALAPIFIALTAAATFFGVSLGIVAGVAGGVIAAIAALIAIGVAIVANWDAISAGLSAAWQAIQAAAISIFTAIGQFLSTVWSGVSAAAVAAWNGIKAALSAVWNGLLSLASAVWTGISNAVRSPMQTLSSALIAIWNGIRSAITAIWNGLRSVSTSVWNGIRTVITSVVNGIRSVITSVFNAIRTLITSIWNGIRSVTSSAWNGIRNTISNGIRSAYNAVRGYVGSFLSAGKGLMSALASGIKSGISSAISAVKSGMSTIRSYLPFSPAKVGPLSDLDKSGESFFPTFASKMNRGLAPMMNTIDNGLRQASNLATEGITMSAVSAGGAVAPVININNPTVRNDDDIRQIAQQVSEVMYRQQLRNQRFIRGGG